MTDNEENVVTDVTDECQKIDENQEVSDSFDDFVHIPKYEQIKFKIGAKFNEKGKIVANTTTLWYKDEEYPIISVKKSPIEQDKTRDDAIKTQLCTTGDFDSKSDKVTLNLILNEFCKQSKLFLVEQKKHDDAEAEKKRVEEEANDAKRRELMSTVVINTSENVINGEKHASLTFRYKEKLYFVEVAVNHNKILEVSTDNNVLDMVVLKNKMKSGLIDLGNSEESVDIMLNAFKNECNENHENIIKLCPEVKKAREFEDTLNRIKSFDEYAGIYRDDKENKDIDTYIDCFVPDTYKLVGFGYVMSDNTTVGACGAVTHRYKDKFTNEYETEKICDCKLMVTGYFTSYDNKNDLVEISYLAPNTANNTVEKRSVVVEFDCIKSHSRFEEEIIPKGVSVESYNIRKTITYLTNCVNANYTVSGSKMKSGCTYDILGWKDANYHTYNSGERLYTVNDGRFVKNECMFVDLENTELTEKLITSGTLANEIEFTRELLKYDGVHFVAFKAFDTLLIKPLNSKACTIGLEYDTSSGKTLVMELVASMFGHPDKLLVPGNTSVPALVARMRANHDHPLFVDDTIDMKEETKKIIAYIATNGREPDRSTNTGKLRGQKELYSNVFITSEIPIISDKAMAGADRRAIIIKKPILPELKQKLIRTAEDGLKENHGHILLLFLNNMLKHQHKLKNWYEQEIERLQEMTPDKSVKRQASYYALAYVAGSLLEDVFGSLGLHTVDAHKIVEKYWLECAVNRTETIGDRALKTIHNLFTRSANKNIVIGKNILPSDKMFEIKGYYNEEFLDMNPEIVKQELVKAGFDKIEPILREWRNRNVIKTDSIKAFTLSTTHYVDSQGHRTKMPYIRFVMAEVEKSLNFAQSTLDDFDVPTDSESAALFQAQKDEVLNDRINTVLGIKEEKTDDVEYKEDEYEEDYYYA